jgi:NitT/TauT family transport system permease protein
MMTGSKSKNNLNLLNKPTLNNEPLNPAEAANRLNPAGPNVETEAVTLKENRPRLALGRLSFLSAALTGLALLALWQILAMAQVYPAYILPSPEMVFDRFGETLANGSLWKHIGTTSSEALLGFGLALVVAGLLCYPVARSKLVATLLNPLLAATQAIPLIALAPLLVLWFGFGILPKVITCALIVFFPLLLNAVSGLRGIDLTLREAAAVFGATRWQAFWMVELPLAMPTLLTGIKIGLTISITGAVVGEFITAESGLGYLLNLGRGQFDTALVFVALLTLAFIAILAYALVTLFEKILLSWQ